MEKHEAFTRWAISQGVELHGVAAHQFPGRGLGIVATERIEVCPVFHIISASTDNPSRGKIQIKRI